MEWIVGFVRAAPEEIRAAGWVPAVLQVERRVDPFTQQEKGHADMATGRVYRSVATGCALGGEAADDGRVELCRRAEVGGEPGRRASLRHAGRALDRPHRRSGRARRLEAVVSAARARRSLTLPLRPSAVRRLLSEDPSAVARRWAETAYFSNFHASAACDAAHDMLVEIVAACAGGEGDLYAISDGYTSA